MELSKEAIEDFKEAYKQDFGENISDDEAREMGVRVLRLFQIITQPIPEDKKDEMKKILVEYKEFLEQLLGEQGYPPCQP